MRRLPLAVWIGLVLIVAASVAHIWLELYRWQRIAPELREGPSVVAHTYEVISTAQSLRRAVQDAERGQRGFLITGDRGHLLVYEKGASEVPALLAKLKALTPDNDEQQRRWPVLEHQVSIKLNDMKQTLAAYQGRGFEAARQIVKTNIGLDAMQGVNSIIDAAIATERSLLETRLARTIEFEREGRETALAGAVLEFTALVLGVVLVIYGTRSMLILAKAQRTSEDRFRLFVGAVTDYAIYMLDPHGTVLEWNAGAERIKGYSANEIVGQNYSRFYTDEGRQKGLPQRALEIAAREGRYEEEGWRVRKDGKKFYASVIIDAVRDASGKLVGFAKVTRDIGERIQQQQALLQYQKMDALGQLTGGIAHDFNNLLHVMRNAVDILNQRLKEITPEVRNYLDMLKRNADRAASLTQRLLAFSRRQILDPRPISPNALILDVTTLLEQVLGESVEVQTVIGAGVWPIHVDPTQLETAVLNIAINARDAMQGGGKLTVEISNAFLDDAYAAAHAEVKPGQYVLIAISDTGGGMSPEVIAKAFDPFFTTKDVGRGTGLGLSQVYGFVKQSGGHAKIYSEREEGTTVKLYFPRYVGEIVSEDGRASVPATLPQGQGTILVVEDEEDVCKFTADVLSQLGYRVLTARDAATAERILESERVDLLFTDIGLPGGVNGRQLADEVQRRFRDIKVLFTTGYTRNAVIHHGRLDPGVDLIVKPFAQATLAEAVKRMLNDRRAA